MSFFVLVQPARDDLAQVHEPTPGVRQLIAGNDYAGFAIQVPARVGGLTDAAQFARALAVAAADFATWCEEQNRTRSYVPDSGEGWAGAHSLRPDTQS